MKATPYMKLMTVGLLRAFIIPIVQNLVFFFVYSIQAVSIRHLHLTHIRYSSIHWVYLLSPVSFDGLELCWDFRSILYGCEFFFPLLSLFFYFFLSLFPLISLVCLLCCCSSQRAQHLLPASVPLPHSPLMEMAVSWEHFAVWMLIGYVWSHRTGAD